MGQGQSKDELLYQQVAYGNAEGIKQLRRDGAGLEWIDKDGKTPLIVACMNPKLLDVANTLIDLGANMNVYRPGRNAGTPLHHAAKRGLENTVKLLLSRGANALVMNDDCQTPLDVARGKGFSNVVRAIESHICLFSGWLREFYGPGFLEALAPLLVMRKVWVVVLPCGARNPTKPFKLELAIYPSLQDARPRAVVALWKANMEEPNLEHREPAVIVHDNPTKTHFKLAPLHHNDMQQLQWFCNACKGIVQGSCPTFLQNTSTEAAPATAPPAAEDLELAMAINDSIQATMVETAPLPKAQTNSEANSSTSWSKATEKTGKNGWNVSETHEAGPSHNPPAENIPIHNNPTPTPALAPSAPPLAHETIDEGPIRYPSIDYTFDDLSTPVIEKSPIGQNENKESVSSTCVICLDAPAEGACIPCGHMAGCMSCLNEIMTKKWGCPVCRANIDQVIKVFAV